MTKSEAIEIVDDILTILDDYGLTISFNNLDEVRNWILNEQKEDGLLR